MQTDDSISELSAPNTVEIVNKLIKEIRNVKKPYFPLLLTKAKVKEYTGIVNHWHLEEFLSMGRVKCIWIGEKPKYIRDDIQRAIDYIHNKQQKELS